ncbi:MAG TPA: class I SAM-dependent methyltransferase [Isosphaeraceae bacterium]|nr:class I SAM-dependent methyltransferase [Isosphaeraceae bacterium]
MTTAWFLRWSKLRWLLRSQGVGGLLEELAARLRYHTTHRNGEIPYHVFRAQDWDRRRGVETEEVVHQEQLDFDSPNREHALGYIPTGQWSFRSVVGSLRDLGVRPSEFTLVDFGCGKGRVLLMALEAGFRSAIGVEFAPDLARTADANLRSYRGGRHAASVHCGDAAVFPIPADPVVLFIANPFTGPVLEAVAENIRRSFAEHPRAMYVVYLFPQEDSPFARGAPFVLVESEPLRAIYRLEAASA